MQITNNIASLQANQTFLNTTANNVANVNTDGFVPQETNITTTANTPNAITTTADNNGSPTSQTDLEKEIPNQIVATGVAGANVTAIQTQDEMLGTLLDIKT